MFLSVIILIGACALVRSHWARLHADEPARDAFFWRWLALGVVGPILFWAVSNLGIFRTALVPEIAIAQFAERPWGAYWIAAMIVGAAAIFLNWAAFTYVWMMLRIARKADHPREFHIVSFLCIAVASIVAIPFVWRNGWTGLGSAILLLFLPTVHMTLQFAERPAPKPLYSKAVAKMKFGKYDDAELEVINQLEKKENDFDGWMMLAELYATQHKRLDDAAQVVVDICKDPTVQAVQVSVACNKLADWHLQLGENPAGARAALDLLIQTLPGTHFAHMAQMRLNQVPRTREEFLEEKNPRALRLPALREHAEDAAPQSVSKQEALKEADQLVARLTADPNHFGNREKLATVLAEKLRKVTLAAEQLRLLIDLQDATDEQRAKWLAQIAAWERGINKNEKAFRDLLEEIIRDYPKTTHAYSARRQLDLIEMEALEKANPRPEPAPRPKLKVT